MGDVRQERSIAAQAIAKSTSTEQFTCCEKKRRYQSIQLRLDYPQNSHNQIYRRFPFRSNRPCSTPFLLWLPPQLSVPLKTPDKQSPSQLKLEA